MHIGIYKPSSHSKLGTSPKVYPSSELTVGSAKVETVLQPNVLLCPALFFYFPLDRHWFQEHFLINFLIASFNPQIWSPKEPTYPRTGIFTTPLLLLAIIWSSWLCFWSGWNPFCCGSRGVIQNLWGTGLHAGDSIVTDSKNLQEADNWNVQTISKQEITTVVKLHARCWEKTCEGQLTRKYKWLRYIFQSIHTKLNFWKNNFGTC